MESRGFLFSMTLGLMVSGSAFAGDAAGIVSTVHMGPIYGTNVFIKIQGTAANMPSCQANQYSFVFDSSTAAGKVLLASVLSAKATGTLVKASGYNQCTLFFNVEDLRWFTIE